MFRGKRIDNGEWVYGYYVGKVDPLLGTKKSFIVAQELDCSGIYNSFVSWHEVDPETVGQHTGLTDKNSVKIFDGDILAGSMYPFTHDGDRNYYAVVVWFENSLAFGIETVKAPGSSVSGISAGNTDYMDDWAPRCWEVIGNIQDNQELLTT